MSIYIKGLDLPKEPMIVKINPDGSVSSTAKNGYRKYEAVFVPKHGRLGDLDELERKIGENIDKAKSREQGAYGWWYACNVAEDFVLSAPTIIEAE